MSPLPLGILSSSGGLVSDWIDVETGNYPVQYGWAQVVNNYLWESNSGIGYVTSNLTSWSSYNTSGLQHDTPGTAYFSPSIRIPNTQRYVGVYSDGSGLNGASLIYDGSSVSSVSYLGSITNASTYYGSSSFINSGTAYTIIPNVSVFGNGTSVTWNSSGTGYSTSSWSHSSNYGFSGGTVFMPTPSFAYRNEGGIYIRYWTATSMLTGPSPQNYTSGFEKYIRLSNGLTYLGPSYLSQGSSYGVWSGASDSNPFNGMPSSPNKTISFGLPSGGWLVVPDGNYSGVFLVSNNKDQFYYSTDFENWTEFSHSPLALNPVDGFKGLSIGGVSRMVIPDATNYGNSYKVGTLNI